MCREDMTVRFDVLMRFFLEIRASFNTEGASELDVIKRFTEPDLLVLDESHEIKGSDWEVRTFAYLINQRYNACKNTILLCNQTRAEFQARIPPAIASRLTEIGFFVECTWPSFRGAG